MAIAIAILAISVRIIIGALAKIIAVARMFSWGEVELTFALLMGMMAVMAGILTYLRFYPILFSAPCKSETADSNLNCNTAYPIFKGEFIPFRKEIDLFEDVRELSFYIHVPFCQKFCSFCEYTRFLAGNRQNEKQYLAAMKEQMESFLETHRIDLLKGFDIGGGTPTSISDDAFYDLMNLHCEIESRLKKSEDYEKSIEVSFPTVSHSKTLLIGQAGFKRVSAGLQYVDPKLDQTLSRETESLSEMREEIELLHHAGVEKVNLDIIYGMPGQDDASVMQTLEALMFLHPGFILSCFPPLVKVNR